MHMHTYSDDESWHLLSDFFRHGRGSGYWSYGDRISKFMELKLDMHGSISIRKGNYSKMFFQSLLALSSDLNLNQFREIIYECNFHPFGSTILAGDPPLSKWGGCSERHWTKKKNIIEMMLPYIDRDE